MPISALTGRASRLQRRRELHAVSGEVDRRWDDAGAHLLDITIHDVQSRGDHAYPGGLYGRESTVSPGVVVLKLSARDAEVCWTDGEAAW
jgi:hypothetical protein